MKAIRIQQRAVDVGLGGEVHDRVGVSGEGVDEGDIADVAFDEPVPDLALELRQVREVAGVGQLVEHRDLDLWALGAHEPDEVRAYETGASGDQEAARRAPRHLMGGPAVQS